MADAYTVVADLDVVQTAYELMAYPALRRNFSSTGSQPSSPPGSPPLA